MPSKKAYAPASWQFDPSQLPETEHGKVQVWSASGCLRGLVSTAEARKLVAAKAAFIGSANHVCEVA